jgi:hypothetical protein
MPISDNRHSSGKISERNAGPVGERYRHHRGQHHQAIRRDRALHDGDDADDQADQHDGSQALAGRNSFAKQVDAQQQQTGAHVGVHRYRVNLRHQQDAAASQRHQSANGRDPIDCLVAQSLVHRSPGSPSRPMRLSLMY